MDCDCTLIPFKEECLKYCTEEILSKANKDEKQSILGFDRPLADAIYNAYNSRSIRSFEDLERTLSPSQVATILNTFRGLTQAQLDYFKNK